MKQTVHPRILVALGWEQTTSNFNKQPGYDTDLDIMAEND
jgi:hypothetical protein